MNNKKLTENTPTSFDKAISGFSPGIVYTFHYLTIGFMISPWHFIEPAGFGL